MSSDKDINKDNTANIMDMIIVIDKAKLPEDIRKLIEEHIPKDMLSQRQLNEQPGQDIPIDNKLYAIQVGEVVGNIYTDKGKDTNK